MTSWHVDDRALQRWIDRTDSLPQSASVEQHLLGCAACRDRVSGGVATQPSTSRSTWTSCGRECETPSSCRSRRSAAHARPDGVAARGRAAGRAGTDVSGRMDRRGGARVVFLATANAYGHAGGLWLFLAIAPLLPCGAVAFSYDPRFEPALEQEVTTPYSAIRLVLLRTAAGACDRAAGGVVLGALMHGPTPYLWLLPAIGFVAGVLALSTWVAPMTAVAAIGVVWALVVGAATVYGSSVDVVHLPFSPIYLALAVVSCAVVAARGRQLRTQHPRRGRR